MKKRYGKKGGDGATAGKRAVTYTAQAPDGAKLKKRSYYVNSPEAVMWAYEHQGTWYAAGVRKNELHPRYKNLQAIRVGQ